MLQFLALSWIAIHLIFYDRAAFSASAEYPVVINRVSVSNSSEPSLTHANVSNVQTPLRNHNQNELCHAERVTFGTKETELISQQKEFWDVETDGLMILTGAVFSVHTLDGHNNLAQSTLLDPSLRTLAFQDADNIVGADSLEGIRFFARQGSDLNWRMINRAPDPLRKRGTGAFSRLRIAGSLGVDIRSNQTFGGLSTNGALIGNSVEDRPSLGINSFRYTNSFDGHVSTIVLDGHNFGLGSSAGRLLRITDGKVVAVVDDKVDRFGFSALSLARGANGRLLLWDQGLVARQNETGLFQPVDDLPLYSRPVMVGQSSQFEYVHGPNRIASLELDQPLGLKQEVDELNNWVNRGWFLKSAALSANSNKSVLLFKSGKKSDTGFAVIDRTRNKVYRYSCARRRPPLLRGDELGSILNNREIMIPKQVRSIPAPEQSITFKEVSYRGERMAVWTTRPRTKQRGRLVYLRGGPNMNLQQDNIEKLEGKLLAEGYEILRYEYSGARQVDPNIYNRLRTDLVGSLKKDAEMIQRDLSQRSKIRTIVFGVSFGAMLAGAISENSDIAVDHFVLSVPFGEWIPPADYAPVNDIEWIKRQSQMQDATIGVPSITRIDAFNTIATNFRQSICRNRVTLIFARQDRSISQNGWRRDCLADNSRILEVDGGHSLTDEMANTVLNVVFDKYDSLPPRRH